jgi:trimeric autotransporter adhesin
MRHARLFTCFIVSLLLSISVVAQQAGSTATALNHLISFNGTLKDVEGNPRVGTIGITVSLYASQEGGDPLWRESQTVQTDEQGRYTVLLGATEKDGLPLDLFGTGKAQWLAVQPEGQDEQPRVLLMAVPYALKAADADTVGGKPVSSFVLYEDLDKAAHKSLPAAMIIMQNGVPRANLGRAQERSPGAANDAERKQLSGNTITPLSYNETGSNTWFGQGAGASITAGTDNSFFGQNAGNMTSDGILNAFFGSNAGSSNTSGWANSFVGESAGWSNTTGGANSFFGEASGIYNTTGYENTFSGVNAGFSNGTGSKNSFFGVDAGHNNTTGIRNSFVGAQSGLSNTVENYNSVFGMYADVAVGIANATAIGYQAKVTQSNSLVLGSISGVNGASADTNVGIGTTAPTSRLTVVGDIETSTGLKVRGHNVLSFDDMGCLSIGPYSPLPPFFGTDNTYVGWTAGTQSGAGNSFFGSAAGYSNSGTDNTFIGRTTGVRNTTGNHNSCLGSDAGQWNTTGNENVVIGFYAGQSNTTEHKNSFIGAYSEGAAGIANSTAVGHRAKVTQSNSLVLGSINGINGATADTKVGIGTTAPAQLLEVRKDQNASTYFQVTNADNTGDASRARFALVGGTVTQEMQSIARDGGYFGTTSNHPFRIYTNKATRVTIDTNGNVGIGTMTPTARLHVVGNLRVTGAIQYGAPEEEMPDYVFEPGYPLMSVEVLGAYVAKEKHLPNVPSAAEVKENGLNLGQFQSRLLEKIEELTLYAVQQAKASREQEVVLERQRAALAQQQSVLTNQQSALEQKDGQIETLKARLAALEQAVQKLSAREGN